VPRVLRTVCVQIAVFALVASVCCFLATSWWFVGTCQHSSSRPGCEVQKHAPTGCVVPTGSSTSTVNMMQVHHSYQLTARGTAQLKFGIRPDLPHACHCTSCRSTKFIEQYRKALVRHFVSEQTLLSLPFIGPALCCRWRTVHAVLGTTSVMRLSQGTHWQNKSEAHTTHQLQRSHEALNWQSLTPRQPCHNRAHAAHMRSHMRSPALSKAALGT
jgi:hypothetical protein